MTQAHADAMPIVGLPLYAMVVGVPLLTLLGVVLFGAPLFEGNDDAGLAMVGAGFGAAVVPEPHVIFSHFGYGLILGLVSRVSGAHAHGWLSLAALGLSMSLYVRALCERGQGQVKLVGTALIVAGAGIFSRALLESQFTITASLLFAAAIACWLATLQRPSRSVLLYLAIFGSMILAFLLRPTAVLLGLVVTGPAIAWIACRGSILERHSARRLIAAIAVLAVFVYLTDKSAYAFSPEWRDTIEYNQVRSLFNDFGRVPWIQGAPQYEKVGWSANDHAMFMNWYSLDPIFDIDKIKYLAQTLLLQQPLLDMSGVRSWFVALLDSRILICLVAIQIFLFILLPLNRTFIALVSIGLFAALALAGVTGRPPLFRVLFPAVGIAVLSTLPYLLSTNLGLDRFQKIGMAFLLATSLYAGSNTLLEHRARVVEAAAYRASLSNAKTYFSGKTISWASALAWEWLITPTMVYAPLNGATVASIGLFSRMPLTRSTLAHLDIDDLSTTLCTEADVRLMAMPHHIALLRKFCEEHYHVVPSYELVFDNFRTQIYISQQNGMGQLPVTRQSNP
jgi:hypothetical protein